ncbi:MAG: helix-turn-helix transcriptional regulator [Chloroflexota bacterium]|nr:helix-turn-helix transcriptional regulator [Chloroflexota bacterium]MDE2895764.1 helix-turn-helix transcriptional regulator [Chloroflexota bacterium]
MTEREKQRQAISSRLRLSREMAGLTQGQVARSLGWHRPTVSELEAGRRRVSAEELGTLAKLYGVSVAWVVGEEDDSSSLAADRVKLAARELSKLREEDLDRVLQLIQAIRASRGATE